ncbi:GNAT family N-acetyltransferase [Streptomyces sp. 549]|uniref:GNAT family N-acetyltransferase n=1 Tax=Streptomyces sp. 549 TaxID=3049076 RepID=UPI0024C4062F|nr:GNAT family N-acetyltransferase [Streptomyces sp. 549]MDK1472351.1 GNAT family N-acetyltransferase [Streptomyces sp. 549]
MPTLERLRPDHAPALLAFERENRAYFAASVPDRGDDYFAHFDARHAELLAEQAAGLHHFHLLVGSEGETPGEAADETPGRVLGRINLVDVADGSAELGFRIAEHAAGRGLATWGVTRLCELAAAHYGLSSLRAAAAVANPGSTAVLVRTGFRRVGETLLAGRPGVRYERRLPPAP